MSEGVRHLALRLAAPTAGLGATIALALLYHVEPQYYYHVLAFIGIEPLRYPFIDLQAVLSWADCWRRGFDVYVTNPCDRTLMDYPPLWLRFTFLPGKESTSRWTLPRNIVFPGARYPAAAALRQRAAAEIRCHIISPNDVCR